MKTKIFLADDHQILRDGLRLLLESQPDFKIVGEAEHGRAALEAIRASLPDVVVLDIAMPELNGIEVARRLSDELPEIKIIILSVYSDLEHIYRALQAGAQGYVLKESAGSELVDAVRTVLRGERVFSPKIDLSALETYLNKRPANPLELLSAREREVLQLTVEGYSSAVIAEKLGLSPKTVETYRSRLMTKLGVGDITELVRFAIRHQLTSLD
jgi:DNA-binding NarL/FixJ family response regulator